MPIPSPPIAGPPYDDVDARTEKLAEALTKTRAQTPGTFDPGWVPPPEGQTDMGRALIRVFGRMARHIIERLNRVPDRNFLAFLNLIGVEPLPPRPARVPLTFTLVERGNAEPIVPAGTRVGAAPEKGDTREIAYETTLELNTTRARLAAAFVRQPDGDRYADRTEAAKGVTSSFYEAFGSGKPPLLGGEQPVVHALYVTTDEILNLPTGTEIVVSALFDTTSALQQWDTLHANTIPSLASDAYYATYAPQGPLIRWSYWNGTSWTQVSPTREVDLAARTLKIKLSIANDMALTSINGRAGRWLQAELVAWPQAPISPVNSIRISAKVSGSAVAPDLALLNGAPVDLSKDFYPLGERPRFNDTFYLASDQVFSRPGASVTVTVTASAQQAAQLSASDQPRLVWEVSTATGWTLVKTTEVPAAAQSPPPPSSLLNTQFVVPAQPAPTVVAGKTAHWLRVRLVSGNFGTGLQVTSTPGPNNTTITTVTDDNRPPIITKLEFTYSYTSPDFMPICISYNYFEFLEHPNSQPLALFTRIFDDPALYLGFDRPFANRNTALYCRVAPLSIDDALNDVSNSTAPSIAWEYWAGANWLPLRPEDETRGFAQSGLIQFIGPLDFAPRAQFGKSLYWLRARLEGEITPMPRLGHVLTNTVWARHTATIAGEVLGSSNGSTDQTFTLSQLPVLGGQQIEVREPEMPSASDQLEIERVEGPDAIQIVGKAERPDEIWVRWHEVPDFYASGPRDRHYQLDRRTGQVQFGNGQQGMVPPRGSRNVKAKVYRTGGGADGNRPVGAVNQLKTTIAYVDAVINREPATGGADTESVDRVKERGPRTVRHGGRAVAAEDFEDLAHEASPAVARANAITTKFDYIALAETPQSIPNAGKVVVLIVPFSPDVPPTPSVGLIQDVQAYLRQRCAPATLLHVVGPEWFEVRTIIDLVPTSSEGTEAVRVQVQEALKAFLHPLTGGFDGDGWRMGQTPEKSDIYRLMASISGVDSVQDITLTLKWSDQTIVNPDDVTQASRLALSLLYSGSHTVNMVSS